MKNKEFNALLENVKNPNDLVELYGKYGVDVPLDIAQELFEPIVADGELLEEDLESVAGGGWAGGVIGKAIGGPVAFGFGYLGGRLAGWSKVKSVNYASKCEKVGEVLGAGLVGALTGPI